MIFMIFDYFYEGQSEKYLFFRIPKKLFTDEVFSGLSTEAKVLYGLLLDRVSLSKENGWQDKDGRIYVFYKIDKIKEDLRCGNTKACGLLMELERFGLIERLRQGQGKPSLIYVKDFSRFSEQEFLNSQNGNSKLSDQGILDLPKSEPNKTDKNKTDPNETYPILSGEDVDKRMEERLACRAMIGNKLDVTELYKRFPYERETIDSLVELLLDVICSNQKTIRIAGEDQPLQAVRERFLKLGYYHAAYILDCMRTNTTKIRNVKQYLLAAIYNAPITINSYYQAMVNRDAAEGNI